MSGSDDTQGAVSSHSVHLEQAVAIGGGLPAHWTYLILFAIVFCETGLVVTPFLPGDSLLFAAGAVRRSGQTQRRHCSLSCCRGGDLGDTVNYWIGTYIGPRAFSGEISLPEEGISGPHAPVLSSGTAGKTIILARFVPIIRTFAPFVAGIGGDELRRFIVYNVVGGIAWVALFLSAATSSGDLPLVKEALLRWSSWPSSSSRCCRWWWKWCGRGCGQRDW